MRRQLAIIFLMVLFQIISAVNFNENDNLGELCFHIAPTNTRYIRMFNLFQNILANPNFLYLFLISYKYNFVK